MLLVDAGRNHGNTDDAFEAFVEGCAKDDVGFRVNFFTNTGRSFIDLEQGHVAATGDRDQKALRTAHGGFVEQRIGDCGLGSSHRTAFTGSFARAHHGLAHFAHDRADVSEVEVNQAFLDHQVGDAGNTRIEHLISHRKSVGKSGLVVGDAEQVLVRNDDERIDILLQFFNAQIGSFHAAGAFKVERLGHNADGEDAAFAGSACHDRRSARAGAAAHACGHKAHMRTVQVIDDFVDAFFRGSTTNFRLRTGAEAFRHGSAKLDDAVGLRHGQSLRVGVGHNEIHAAQAGIDHVVDRIAAAAADTEYGDAGLQLGDIRLLQIDSHWSLFLLSLSTASPPRCRLVITLMVTPQITQCYSKTLSQPLADSLNAPTRTGHQTGGRCFDRTLFYPRHLRVNQKAYGRRESCPLSRLGQSRYS